MATNMNVSVTLRLIDQFTQNTRAAINTLQQLTRAAQDFNRSMGGAGTNSPFTRITQDVRALSREVRDLAGRFQQLGRAAGTPSGGIAQQQVQQLRQMLNLQQQAIANNARLASGGGSGRVPNVPGVGSSFWGSRGFHPNASLIDRAQYRGVNIAEQTLVEGALSLDRARTRLSILGTPDEIRQQAEEAAAIYSRVFSGLSQADILETFGEVVTQFRTPQEGLQLLPELLRVQQWQILAGDTRERAREGMLALLRGIGLSGRLTGPEGNLTLPESQGFLDAYLRARIIGGADVNPSQAFQLVKYLKSTGQTLSTESLLEAFIAMPDLRASTYGNQLNMLVRQLTGTATQTAQQAMARAGLGTITERSSDGPHGFQAVDEELLRSNPGAWIERHVAGPQGYLRRMGLDPLRSSAAQIATALRPLFSNQSAENIANMIINQRQEWLNQIQNALALDLREETRVQHQQGSLWTQLTAVRSQASGALGEIMERFKPFVLQPLQTAADLLTGIARWVNPRTGSDLAAYGVLGAGAVGSFMLLRSLARSMGATGRTAIGGALGLLIGGDIIGALTGGLMLRGMGGTAATTAAAAAATAVATTWGRRFLAVAGRILAGGLRFTVGSIAIAGLAAVVENWQAVGARLKEIWEDLRQAAPTWAGGEGRGWSAFAQGPAVAQTGRELSTYLQENERGVQDWLRGTALGQWLIQNGWAATDAQMAARRYREDMRVRGLDPQALDLADQAAVPRTGGTTVTMGNIVNHIVVNVAGANASPAAIGEAAGNAVGSALRGLMADPLPIGVP